MDRGGGIAVSGCRKCPSVSPWGCRKCGRQYTVPVGVASVLRRRSRQVGHPQYG
jgi:hypothetical protein